MEPLYLNCSDDDYCTHALSVAKVECLLYGIILKECALAEIQLKFFLMYVVYMLNRVHTGTSIQIILCRSSLMS